jgi:hypothetical protein
MDRHIDEQTRKKKDKLTSRQVDKHRQAYRQLDRQAGRLIERQIDRQAGRLIDRHLIRQAKRQNGGWTDKQVDRLEKKTNIQTEG